MTALFDEPLRVTLRPDRYPVETEHPVGMLLGFAYSPGQMTAKGGLAGSASQAQCYGVVCLADGSVALLPSVAYTIDWRYVVETDRFIDLNVPKEEQDT